MSSSSKNSFRSHEFAIVQRTVLIYCFPSEDLNTRKAVQIRSRKWTCDCGEERDTGADHRSLVAKNGSGTGLRCADLGDLYAESGQTLQGSFSAVSKPNFASKYALESSRRDLHDALLCTALKSHLKNVIFHFLEYPDLAKFADIPQNRASA